MKCRNKNPKKKDRSRDLKTINFIYFQVDNITLKHKEMWSSGMASHGMKIWIGSCGCAGRKKMKVRVLGFLGIRGI